MCIDWVATQNKKPPIHYFEYINRTHTIFNGSIFKWEPLSQSGVIKKCKVNIHIQHLKPTCVNAHTKPCETHLRWQARILWQRYVLGTHDFNTPTMHIVFQPLTIFETLLSLSFCECATYNICFIEWKCQRVKLFK